MQYHWVIVDGYSLLHRDGKFATTRREGLDLARRRLIRRIEEVADSFAERVTVVFDGRSAGAGDGYESSSVEVLFSPSHQTADTVIERIVHDAKTRNTILVVTSDRAERETVEATGAHSMSCGDFNQQCDALRERIVETGRRKQKTLPRTTLGDFFPEE